MRKISNFKFLISNKQSLKTIFQDEAFKLVYQFLMNECFKHLKLGHLKLNEQVPAFGSKNLKLRNKNYSNGFTLIELIIYMALLSMFLLVLTNIFIAILRVRVESQASSSAEQDGRFIMTRLAYDVNRATVTAVPNATTLNLTIGGQSYSYTVVNSKLQLTQPSGTDILNSSSSIINNITFQRILNVGGREDTIKIQFTVDSTVKRGNATESRVFMTTIGRRIR